MPTLLSLTLAVAWLVGPAQAQDDSWTPIPRDVLFGETDKTAVALDPQGTRVGWLSGPPGQRQLSIASVESPDEPVVLDLPGLVSWLWAANGDVLAIATDGQGDRLLVVDPQRGDSTDRTPVDGAALRFVGTSPHRARELVVSVRTTQAGTSGVYRIRLDGQREVERLMGLSGFDRFWTDGQLEVRLARRPIPNGAILLRNVDGDWVEHARYGWEESRLLDVVSVSADGRTAWIVDDKGLDKAALKQLDIRSGKEHVVAQDPLADLLGAGATVDPDDGSVQAVVSYFARLRRQVLDPSLEADFELLRSIQPGDLSFAGRSADDSTWLVRFMDGGPFDYFVYDRATRRARRLFSDHPELDGAPLATRHAVTVAARDGLLLPCHVYLPAGTDPDGDGVPSAPLPTVLYVHGGPWVGFEWNSWFTNRNFQLLADRGYAVIRTEFRGAGGYGREFMDAGDGQWGAAMHEDLLDIRNWAVERGLAADDRIALWGWSYGGYATLAGLTTSPDEFAAGLSMYGVSDLVRFTEELVDAGGDELWIRRVGDVRHSNQRDRLREQSPLSAADRMTRPLLVTHGGMDTRTPRRQSDLIVEALAARGHPVTYLVYPDEPHDYRQPVSWTSFWAVGERFLAEHLGGRYQPWNGELGRARVEVVTGAEYVPGLAAQLPDPSARADVSSGAPPR